MVIIYERNRIHMGIAFSENGYTKEVFDLADEALYKSKSAGKHAITINDFVVKKLASLILKSGTHYCSCRLQIYLNHIRNNNIVYRYIENL